MVERLTTSEFDRRTDLPDWRILLTRIEATFEAGSFEAGAALVAAIAAAADAAGHHPDVDLRYPGLVHVTLSTHAAGGLTERDADLAATISALAAEAGARARPAPRRRSRSPSTPSTSTPSAVLAGRPRLRGGAAAGPAAVTPARPPRHRAGGVVPADGRPPAAAQPHPHRRHGGRRRGRRPHGRRPRRRRRLLTDQYARSFWVLADPEGNEACICTWLDRD